MPAAPDDKPELVSTGVAANAIGVTRHTLWQWWHDGVVTPEKVTAGGQARWSIPDLEYQVAEQRRWLPGRRRRGWRRSNGSHR